MTMEDYLDLIQRKTADLFSACALTGAILAESGDDIERAMSDYGQKLGIAFQLIDDNLDYGSTEERLGKPVCNDLGEGKVTYPLLVLFDRCPEAIHLVNEIFKKQGASQQGTEKLMELIEAHEVLEETVSAARRFAAEAEDSLAIMPTSEYLDALRQLPTYIIEREK